MSTRRLPLFPLNVVLFPGMPLPLHVFEPRYREMVQRCMQGDRLFGVCLIRSGEEVGGPADPHSVGSTCEILEVTPLEEDRMQLTTVGRERFRILRLFHELPYLEAEIELWPDPAPATDLGELAQQVREATERYVETMLRMAGHVGRAVRLPDDPAKLSLLVGAILQAPPGVRQGILEAPDLRRRLDSQLAALDQETERLAVATSPNRRVARRLKADPGDLSLN